MPKATGIDHIAFYVSDMEAAKQFFVVGLGLVPYADYGDEFFMNVGEQSVALFAGANKTQTINHLALKVDDLEGMKKHLESLGYMIYKEDMVDGPDSLRIQLIS